MIQSSHRDFFTVGNPRLSDAKVIFHMAGRTLIRSRQPFFFDFLKKDFRNGDF